MLDWYTRVYSTIDREKANRDTCALSKGGIACKIKTKAASKRSFFATAGWGSLGEKRLKRTDLASVKREEEERALHLIKHCR